MTKEQAREMAMTILYQLSGAAHTGRLTAMLGAKNFGHSSEGQYLRFQFKMCKKANVVVIHLNGKDLYDVKFYKYNQKTGACPEVTVFNDVYCDQLKPVFENYTGLRTHL